MGVSRVIGENREQVDVLEGYLGIVGASTLKLGDSMGEVRSMVGGRSCVPAEWTCMESYDNGACGGVGVVPVYTLIGS